MTATVWDATVGAFRVTGFAEATGVLRGDGWSSDPRRNPAVSAAVRELPPGSLLFSDPPEHTRYRRPVGPAFTPRSVERLRARVGVIADAALDGLDGIGPDVDVLHDLAYPVTLAIIAELLDVGVEGAALLADQTPKVARGLDFDATTEEVEAAAAAGTELTLFLTPILVDRMREPGDDFVSALLALDGLSVDQVLSLCILLLGAGHETTANVVANSTLALLRSPDQIAHLIADRGRAVEELLRTQGAAKVVARTAIVEQQVGGVPVPAGHPVLVDVRRANHDPRRWTGPDTMDLTRPAQPHLAFGTGPHVCLGAALARLETGELLTRLFARYPGMVPLGPEPRWRDSDALHALEELPVRLT